jgi:hypothetical protein
MTSALKNRLSFDETVCVAVNSVGLGLMDREAAIQMITEAGSEKVNDLEKGLQAAVISLEQLVEKYRKNDLRHPLDEMTIEYAEILYKTKGMLLYCRNGHAVSMFRETKVTNEPLAACQ